MMLASRALQRCFVFACPVSGARYKEPSGAVRTHLGMLRFTIASVLLALASAQYPGTSSPI